LYNLKLAYSLVATTAREPTVVGGMMAGHAMVLVLLSAPLGVAVTPGPGSGAWEHGRPEDHGMLSSQSES
jgi:hypothetical protein